MVRFRLEQSRFAFNTPSPDDIVKQKQAEGKVNTEMHRTMEV